MAEPKPPDASKPSPPSGYGNRTTLAPTREYHIPGGPIARSAGKVEIKILAEIERGGPDDKVR
jgi:hypothetical protein